MNATNKLLNIFFEEIETGIDNVLTNGLAIEETEGRKLRAEATDYLKKQMV